MDKIHQFVIYQQSFPMSLHYYILFCFQDESERLWFAGLIEESVQWTLEADRQTQLAELLLKSQVQYTSL